MSRRKIESAVIKIFHTIGLLFFIFSVAFPFYWMIVASLKPLIVLAMNPLDLWLDPAELTLKPIRISGSNSNSVATLQTAFMFPH